MLICLVAQAPERPSPSPPARVALMPVLVDAGEGVTASEIFRIVSKQTQLRKTVRLMSIDEFFFNDGGRRADAVRACGSDIGCVARQLAPFSADLGLVVVVNGRLKPPLYGVLTLDTRRERLIAERYKQVDRRRLTRSLRATIAAHLDQAGHPRWGRLAVDVEPPRATIVLSPAYAPEVGRANAFIVPPGAYTVRAELESHITAEKTTQVTGGQTARVDLRLMPEAHWYQSPWVWVGAAIVVAAAAATVTAVTLSSETTCGCVITADRPMCPPCP